MKLISVTCPNCGGNLKTVSNTKVLTCDYCNCEVVVDDEVKRFQLQDAEQAGYEFEMGRQRALQDIKRKKKLSSEAAVNGVCPLCGRSIVVDKRYEASTCCFCDNVIGSEDAINLTKCNLYEITGLYEEELAVYEKVWLTYPESSFVTGEIERLKEKLARKTENNDIEQKPDIETNLPDPVFGRMSRGLFAILFIALWILFFITFGVISDIWGSKNAGIDAIIVLVLLISLRLFIGRLHDLNRSAWLSVFAFIPYINIVLLGYLLFGKGTCGPNRFGAELVDDKTLTRPDRK